MSQQCEKKNQQTCLKRNVSTVHGSKVESKDEDKLMFQRQAEQNVPSSRYIAIAT